MRKTFIAAALMTVLGCGSLIYTSLTAYGEECGSGGEEYSYWGGACGTGPDDPAVDYRLALAANPSSVQSGNASTLSWDLASHGEQGSVVLNANCTIDHGVGRVSLGDYAEGPDFTYRRWHAIGSVQVTPAQSTTYTMTCNSPANAGGDVSASATVTVTPGPAPTATLTATPSSIASGESSTLSWSSTNATSCTGTGFGTASATSGTSSVAPAATTNYSVSCTGPGGTATAAATLTVSGGVAPDLSASLITPSSATAATPVTLAATISNTGSASTGSSFTDLFQRATDSSGSGATDIGTFANSSLGTGASGVATRSYTFPSAGTYYVRACADKSSASDAGIIPESDETNNCSSSWTQVHVCASGQSWDGSSCTSTTPVPTCSFTANSSAVPPTLSWSCNDASYCTGGGFSTGNATSGNATVSTSGTYTLSCTGPGGTAPTQTVTVGTTTCSNPTADLTAAPDRIRPNTHTTISYTASGINTSCVVTGPGVNQPVTASSCLVSPGTVTTPNLTTQATYVITCDGVERDRAIVNVVPNFEEF